MSKITQTTTREQLAAIVVQKLTEHKIDAVLVGGSVVSIYTNNKYVSYDLDFISPADHKRIEKAMSELGFKTQGKDFVHDHTSFTVEFPTGPLAIGDDLPIEPEGKLKVSGVTIKMFSPTQSVMDRLTWFYFSNDRQCLDQAIMIAQQHPISLDKVRDWSIRENQTEKLEVFLKRLKQ